MKIVKINASFSCKKQIRQYEPIDIFMAVEAEVELDMANDEVNSLMKIQKAQDQLFSIAKAGVDEQIERLTGRPSTPTIERERVEE